MSQTHIRGLNPSPALPSVPVCILFHVFVCQASFSVLRFAGHGFQLDWIAHPFYRVGILRSVALLWLPQQVPPSCLLFEGASVVVGECFPYFLGYESDFTAS